MRLPTPQEAAEGGFEVCDFEVSVDIWPENWDTVQLFSLFNTQWGWSYGGPTGLNYNVVYETLDRKGYTGDEWWQMLDDLRVMESEALRAMREK